MTICWSGYREQVLLPNTAGSGGGASTWQSTVTTFNDLSTIGTPSVTPPPVDGESESNFRYKHSLCL